MSDDAQRDFEQKALRNVRNLVDKIEDEDKAGNQKQLVYVIAIVAVVAALAAMIMLGRTKSGDAKGPPKIEIPPPKPPGAPKT
jgi:hypothetical protein